MGERAAGEIEALMSGYQQADGEATATLITRLSPQIFQFFLAQVRDRSLAEDLLQDFWLRVHKARHTFRAGEPLLPWVFAIARRTRSINTAATGIPRATNFSSKSCPTWLRGSRRERHTRACGPAADTASGAARDHMAVEGFPGSAWKK